MQKHTKRQAPKPRFPQHALPRHARDRSLFSIFTQAEMAEE